MLTKTDFCKMKIEEFAKLNNLKFDEVDDIHIYQSSTLAVCMEYLGLLKSDKAREYTLTRGGTIFTYWDGEEQTVKILTARELIELLPE